MPILFACSCGQKLQAREEHIGSRVKCPGCGTETTVPGPEDDDEERPRRRSRERDEEKDDRPRRRRRPRSPGETSSRATVALILGLLGFLLGALTGIPAIIQGLKSLREIDSSCGRLGGKRMAIAGMVLGGITSFVFLVVVCLVITRIGETRDRTIVMSRMREMTTAMHTHESLVNRLPTAAPIERVPPPMQLSWRVQLLPHLGGNKLAHQFHLNEPWDSPGNKALLTPMPEIFAHPRDPKANAHGLTYYRVFIGANAPFHPDRVTRLGMDFPDGIANTILIVEAAEPVPWTKPDELPYDRGKPVPKLGGHFRSGTVVGMADGAVRVIRPELSEQTLRCLIDPGDGQMIGPDWWRE
jgi:hypothetical protein